jgi:regulatory protein
MLNYKQISEEEAFQKIRHYCAYQERCHSEVKEKLYSYGLHKASVEKILSGLVEDNYLNEERFAIQFAGGKFRTKQWGRVKIKHALQQKRLGTYCIKIALRQIDDDDYISTLKKLATAKWISLKGEQYLNRYSKAHNYLLQKGYEPTLIQSVLSDLRTQKQG